MFNSTDLEQIIKKNIKLEQLTKQLDNFIKGFPFLKVTKAAIVGDGILRIEKEAIKNFIQAYENNLKTLQVCKFVPASGAASRMFKVLFSFMENGDDEAIMLEDNRAVFTFFNQLEEFAFYHELKSTIAHQGNSLTQFLAEKKYTKILQAFLGKDGMNYGSLPKGLLLFHNYDENPRTPVEEHLVEGANYCNDQDGIATLHFTVSPEHQSLFEKHIDSIKDKYESKLKIKYDISFSEQKSYTDTIAVDLENKPFRNEDQSILFRPGGHGALIENLNILEADIVFIKNIDNVVPDTLKEKTFTYKKLLGGILIDRQNKIFNYLKVMEQGVNDSLINEIVDFLENDMYIVLPSSFNEMSISEKTNYIVAKLNRPIRICGMVKNEGEPGGGPFWSVNADGSSSLQIVESSQIDLSIEIQKNIQLSASHFNPVDLVCGIKNYKGEKFDLPKFRDPQTGFITLKSKNGRELKAQELPGLWNGAMANWNTIFLEVPIITFNPVKTINDLLRKEHSV